MKSPGKIIGFCIVLASALYGGVTASVDENRVVMGDSVTYTLKVSGQEIEKPSIIELCGSKVFSTSEKTNMRMEGSSFTKETLFAYVFEPLKDCRIAPITLTVDGKQERTEAIDIKVVPMQITKDSPFKLEMTSEKPRVRVGEPFKVTVTFKQRRDAQMLDSKFEPPKFKNFWVKEQVQGRTFEEGEYSVVKVTYVLAAQKAGKLDIEPAQIRIAGRVTSRNSWGQLVSQLRWRSYFSGSATVEALPLPDGVSLVGHFDGLSVEADKQEIDANEAVNLTLKVTGSGNFEDIGSLAPKIPGVSVFEESPQFKDYLEQGAYKGSWSQKLACVAERGFTVPALSLRYFDTETETVKTLRSAPVEIRVRNAAPEEKMELKIARAEPEAEQDALAQMGATAVWGVPFGAGLLVGLAAGAGLAMLPWGLLRRRKEERLRAKDRKAVLMELLLHRDDPEAAEMITRLETSLYGGEGEAVDEKALRKLLKRLRR